MKKSLAVPLLFAAYCLFFSSACTKTPPPIQNGRDLSNISYNPTPYNEPVIKGLPAMEHPLDNPITEEGVELGRHLFYDPILSRDSTISCATCHQIKKAFADGLAKSVGIDGRLSRRGSMPLINVGYNALRSRPYNFMWDGRFETLEQQILNGPIEDFVEMDNTWEAVEQSLRQHPSYPERFRKAFGIENSEEISREMVAKAIAQFERTLNSAGSPFDRYLYELGFDLPDEAMDGLFLFMGDASNGFGLNGASKDAECAHCHSISPDKVLFARNEYSNNGLTNANSFNDFPDNGFGEATGNFTNNGMFREVTVRNIALTPPYMHDGRFQTLGEVVDHYVNGVQPAPNLASELTTAPDLPTLTPKEQSDIVAFLHALTDTSYFNKPEWQNPF